MNRKEFTRLFSKSAEVSGRTAKKICDAVFDLLGMAIQEEERIAIDGVGVFEHKFSREHSVIHPATGERTIVPAHERIRFRPSDCVRRREYSSSLYKKFKETAFAEPEQDGETE